MRSAASCGPTWTCWCSSTSCSESRIKRLLPPTSRGRRSSCSIDDRAPRPGRTNYTGGVLGAADEPHETGGEGTLQPVLLWNRLGDRPAAGDDGGVHHRVLAAGKAAVGRRSVSHL